MRFYVLRNFSEMTGIGAVGNGPDMALGATPATRRKRKKLKVEFIGVAARAASPLLRKAAPFAKKAIPAIKKFGGKIGGAAADIASDPNKRRRAVRTAKVAFGHAKNVHRAFKFAKRTKARYSSQSSGGQQRGASNA